MFEKITDAIYDDIANEISKSNHNLHYKIPCKNTTSHLRQKTPQLLFGLSVQFVTAYNIIIA
jgi:hypothetical protein